MEDKPKRRSRPESATDKAPPKVRKAGRPKKGETLPPALVPVPVPLERPATANPADATAPLSLMYEPAPLASGLLPASERMDATLPLPPRSGNGTHPLTNGGMTEAGGSTHPAATRITCQQVEAVYLSDVGQVRQNNEDSASAFLGTVPRPDGAQEMLFGFLAVADGMGGHERGEVASNIAVRKMTEGVIKNFYLPTMAGRQPGREGESPMDVLRNLIEDTNQAIVSDAVQNRLTTGMGTTLTCAVLVGQTALIGHVGDSRLYIMEKSTGQLRQVTHDHSMVQRLVDMGQLTAEEAANSQQRSVLYNSLGQQRRVDADVEIVSLNDVEYMLICSDGLWDMVEDYQIEHILKKGAGPGQVSSELIAAANENGGDDNVTVVVARF